MSTGEFENDPLRGQEPGAEVPYRGICWRAAVAATAEREVRGSQTLIARRRYWMSSRERLRALKEAPISLPLPSILLSPSTIVIPRASLFQLLLPSYVIRSLYDVRRTFEERLCPSRSLPTLTGWKEPSPVTLKGERASSHIPFAPIFHKRY